MIKGVKERHYSCTAMGHDRKRGAARGLVATMGEGSRDEALTLGGLDAHTQEQLWVHERQLDRLS